MKYQFIKAKLAFLSLSIIIALACCTSRRYVNQSFSFIQMTDPQFGMFSDNKDFAKETENFEKAIAEANRLHPAFVVVTGDLVNKSGDAKQIAEYKRIVATLDKSIPIYHVPGNHDVTNAPTNADIVAFNKLYGPDYFTIKYHGMVGIVLNTLYFKNPAGVQERAEQQDKWLRKELKKAKSSHASPIVVFQHHSWFLTDPQEKDEYFNIPSDIRRKYLNLFNQYGVSHVFAGHYHRNAVGKAGNLEMVTTGPVGKPLGKDPSGFRIVTIDGNKVTHKYYNLDSIPPQLNLSRP